MCRTSKVIRRHGVSSEGHFEDLEPVHGQGVGLISKRRPVIALSEIPQGKYDGSRRQSASDPLSGQLRLRSPSRDRSLMTPSEAWDLRYTMAPETTVDNLCTDVGQLDVSGRRSPEYTVDGDDIVFMPKVSLRVLVNGLNPCIAFTRNQTLTRDYIKSHQPWDSISLPPQYIPDGKLRWFPPLFFLGIPLTTEEVVHFARHLGLSVRGDGDYNTYYVVARHLSEICGFTVPDSSYPLHRVTVEECDTKGRPWMLALVSNYQIPQGFDYSDPYTVLLEALEAAFGTPKRIEWWLERPLNHTPKDLMVRG